MKRLFTAFLCVIMVGSMVLSSAALTPNTCYFDIIPSESFTVGDANNDGLIDMQDSLDIKKACAGVGTVNHDGADINCDGIMNAKDLLIIKKCNAGIDSIENYDDGHMIDAITIAGNDISEYTIVYHDGAKYVESAYFAGDSLRKYINMSAGINLKVSDEQVTPHKIEFVDVTGIEGLEEKLGLESYFYEVVDGDLFIYGTRRGSLYAVSEIAEDLLGFRFYSDDFVYLNEARVVDIPEGTYSYREPALDFRFAGQSFSYEKGAADYHYFPRRLNGTSINGNQEEFRGTLTGPEIANAHSYDYYWRMATGVVDVAYDGTNGGEYGAKFEAGFQQDAMDWNPCSTDDYVYATLFRGLLEAIRYHTSWKTFWKDTTSVSFSICDNPNYFCSCPDCRNISATGMNPDKTERLGCGGAGLNLYLANRACRDIQVYYEGRPASMEEYADGEFSEYGYGEAITDAYPGLKLFTILYDHTPPHENLLTDARYEKIVPADNLVIMYCGNPCNNHYMGSGECGENLNILGQSGKGDAEALELWGKVIKQTGTEMWFWYYPVNYNTYLTDSPNVFNIWHDFKYIVEECNITGIFYEGGGPGYLFENLKAHLGAMMMWSFEKDENGNTVFMSYEQFCETIKEYLYIFYGEGYEYIYEYIEMQDEAGNVNDVIALDSSGNVIYDENGEPVKKIVCYVNNCDYPGDMFDYEYIRDNYEYMRGLLTKALALAEGDQIKRIENLIVGCDVLGLSACHKSWYFEGEDEALKALFAERYTWMYNYIKENNMYVGIIDDVQAVELDLEKTPLQLYYRAGTWRKAQDDKWIWTGSTPSWGYYG